MHTALLTVDSATITSTATCKNSSCPQKLKLIIEDLPNNRMKKRERTGTAELFHCKLCRSGSGCLHMHALPDSPEQQYAGANY
jgi:hypothetical protein